MAIKIIMGWRDPEYAEIQHIFDELFSPDDWDHVIIGDDVDQVQALADRLGIFDSVTHRVDDKWIAVTYHS